MAHKAMMASRVAGSFQTGHETVMAPRCPALVPMAASRYSVRCFTGMAVCLTGERIMLLNAEFPESSIQVRFAESYHPKDTVLGQEPQRETYNWVEARNITGRLMGLPVFYWPVYAGDPEDRIVKDLRIENRSGSGGAILTTLNLYPLLGLASRKNVSLDLLADLYFERGPVGL